MAAHERVAPDANVAASLGDDEGADAPAPAGTLVLPDELLRLVFNFCDARTRMMTIPAVSKRWLGVCQNATPRQDRPRFQTGHH